MKTNLLGALAVSALLVGCGTDRQDRVTGGAATGAAAGAGVGALGGPPGVLAGAAIGGGAGAVTGAATDARDLNLGQPVWNDPNVRVPGTRGGQGATRVSGSASETRGLQRSLNERGFNAGPVDGVYGPRTRQAVMDYQRQNNMDATGRASPQLMDNLGVQSSGSGRSDRDGAYMGGGMVVGQQQAQGQAQGQAPGGGMRDAAGNQMGGVSASGAEGAGSMQRAPTGTSTLGTGARSGQMRDAAGNQMGGVSTSGAEGSGSMERSPTGTSALGGPGGGATVRPNPSATGSTAMPAPSNNPMNDPVGGASQGTRPGFNQNR